MRGGRNRDEGKDGSRQGNTSQGQSRRHLRSPRRDELGSFVMTKGAQLRQTNTNPAPASRTKPGWFLGNAFGEEQMRRFFPSPSGLVPSRSSSPGQGRAPSTPGCPRCHSRPLQHGPRLSPPPLPPPASCRQLRSALGLGGIGERRGFFDSCSQAQSTREAPRWPLPFPAQHGQEHELWLWH